MRLSEIKGEQAGDFAAHRSSQGLQAGSINSSLRVLRRVLRLAIKRGTLEAAPKIELLHGERRRERVVTPEEEARYLAAASPLLADVATLLADTGLGPDQCHRLRGEDMARDNGRNGTLLVTRGKTAAARRVIPMTPEGTATTRRALGSRWKGGTGSMVHTALTFPSSQSMRNSIPDESEVSDVVFHRARRTLADRFRRKNKTHGRPCVSA